MYADRHAHARFDSGSMSIAIGINAVFVAALLLSAPEIIPRLPPRDLPIDLIPLPKPPDPLPEIKPVQRTDPAPAPRPDAPIPDVATKPADTGLVIVSKPAPFPDSPGGTGTGVAVDPPKPPPSLFVQPAIDPRYADAFQPPYPAEERRAGREGRVVVKVLIGVDGRVKQIERISAATDAFYAATLRQATARWRFKPATRDGIPVDAWRTISLTFVLRD